jgi:LCP family protein required for cell wall assembly
MSMSQSPPRRPSPFGAATASAAFPGWGQLRAGHRRLGLALAAGSVVFLAATAVAVVEEGAVGVVGWLVDPEVLLTLLLLNLLVATVRVWSIAHAWVVTGGRLAHVGLVALVLAVGVPHAAAGFYIFETRSTLISVFAPPPAPIPMAAAETSTTTGIITTTVAAATSTGPVSTSSPSTTDPTTTTTTLPLGTARFTVLLLGGDAGPGRRGLRTDSMMVVSVNTLTGDAAVFGLPRNMGGFTFSDGTGFPGLGRGMLNEVYEWGRRNPERFGGIDPGAAAVADVASNLLGMPIDHFVLVEMAGFARMIDVLGGVTLEVRREIVAPLYNGSDGTHTMITIPAGSQHLDGDLALAFARSRTGSNDYDRMSRQRCLIAAVVDQVEPLSVFAGLPDLLHAVEDNVTTDIPLSKIPYIVNLAPLVATDRVVVIGFDRGFRGGQTENGLMRPDVAAIQAAVQSALSGDPGDGDLSPASVACAP